jgi:hypothetical protein
MKELIPKPMLVRRDVPPDLVIQCQRRPARPPQFASIDDALEWAIRWGYSGEDCRALSDKQGKWIGSPPT